MSIPFSFEQLARIRDDIRRLAARAADHQHELEAVVRAAEADVREAEAARSHALVGVEVTADELQRLPAGRRRCRNPRLQTSFSRPFRTSPADRASQVHDHAPASRVLRMQTDSDVVPSGRKTSPLRL
jgi:hypothetical protein